MPEQKTKLYPMPFGVDLDEKEWKVIVGPNMDLFVSPISEAQEKVLDLLKFKHVLLLGEDSVRRYENEGEIDTDYCEAVNISDMVITDVMDMCRGYNDFREITKEELLKHYKR